MPALAACGCAHGPSCTIVGPLRAHRCSVCLAPRRSPRCIVTQYTHSLTPPGTGTCYDWTLRLRVQAQRAECKRRKFLEHNKRLHDYAEARDAKAAISEAMRVKGKMRQQLRYLESLDQRAQQQRAPTGM